MSITVVTTRDESGAPTTREVYAVAVKYATGNDNLEIFSEDSRLLGLYPSGSWTSVYVDDTVRVVPATAEYASNAGAALDEVLGSDIGVDVDAGSTVDGDGTVDADSAGPDLVEEFGGGADPDVAEPDIEQGILAEPDPEPGPEPARAPEAERVAGPSGPSPLLRPVVFAPKTYKGARGGYAGPTPGPASDPARSGMQQVVFRPRIYRAARGEAAAPDSTPDPARSGMRQVVFRPKIYRAARADAAPQAHDQPDGGEQTDSDRPGEPA